MFTGIGEACGRRLRVDLRRRLACTAGCGRGDPDRLGARPAALAARFSGQRLGRPLAAASERRRSRRRTRSWRRTRLSNIHNDTWMTDAYPATPGPLGKSLVATSEAQAPAGALRVARLRPAGRIVSVCPSIGVSAAGADHRPGTLATIATYDLPNAPDPPGTKAYQNFSGGGYFFLDSDGPDLGPDQDRPHLRRRRVGRRAEPGPAPDYDLTSVLDTGERADHLGAAGLLGADLVRDQAERQGRHAGTRRPGAVHVKRLDEEIENSFAVGRQRRLHRLRQADVPLQGAQGRHPLRRLEARLSELGDRQAEPGRRRLGDDADDHGRRLRRDHRQRRPDERRRLPQRASSCATARSGSSARCRSSTRAPARPRTR